MIKNIIFDLGNVLISFKPADYLDKAGYAPEAVTVIINDIFQSVEWDLIDNGAITTKEAIEKISERSSMKREEIASVFDSRTKIMYPVNSNVKLLPGLKNRGLKLYYLSNFPDDIFEEVYKEYEFFSFFDGGIISSRVKQSKPNIKIFEILLEKYSLRSDECLFIDDIEINVSAAIKTGMKGIKAQEDADLLELIEKELERVPKK
jgi:FMN phosphatase YigB (HAD superfamily)